MAAHLGLQLNNAQLNLAPGDTAEVTLVVSNTSQVVDAYAISVVGLDPRWYDLSSAEVRLFPQQQANVTLKIHPPAGSMSTLAGFHAFTVMVVSRDNPTEQAFGQGTISIAATGGLALALDPKRITGRRGLYGVTVTNSSNTPRSFVLTVTDAEEALHYSLGTPQERTSALDGADGTSTRAQGGDLTLAASPAYGSTTVQAARILEHELEVAPGASLILPLLVKPEDRVWTGSTRAFPFQAGLHPPGVDWEATDAQAVQAELAYKPVFSALAGIPVGTRRLLAIAIPLLILGLLLFLLFRTQEGTTGAAVSQTQTALALSAGQTQTAQALSISQTMTAVMVANGGNAANANATLTAMAQSSGAQTASAQLTASARQTALAQQGSAAGVANIDQFYLFVGTPGPDGLRPESEIAYDVAGATDVRISSQSRLGGIAGLENASILDYTMVATGTNRQPTTSTLSLLVILPPAIGQFEASPSTVTSGESTILSWSTRGAQGVTIDDIPVTSNADGSGQITLTPTGTRRFIMCASNGVGMNCKMLLVTVIAPGAPTPTPVPPAPPTQAPANTRVPPVPNTAVPTRVPTTAVPIALATMCADNYFVERVENVTPVALGSLVPGSQCSDCTVNIALPFTFQLYDRLFDGVNIGANGTLSFATNSSPATNTFFDNDTLNYSILPHWDNLVTTGAGRGIFTRVDGDAPARIFTIGYRARYAADQTNVNFDVRLFENSPDLRVEVIYGSVPQTGSSASVGLQMDTADRRAVYTFNEAGSLRDGYQLIFRLPCGAGLQCSTGATVILSADAITPDEVLLEKGSTVVWVNGGNESRSIAGTAGTTGIRWNSGAIAPGKRYSRIFETVGAFDYTSNTSPALEGRIRVVDSCLGTATPTRAPSNTPVTAVPTPPITASATRTLTPTTLASSTPSATGTSLLPSLTPSPSGTSTAPPPTVPPTVPPTGFCPAVQSFTGSILASDPTQAGRVEPSGAPSTCVAPTSCSPAGDSAPRNYDTYTFTNVSGSSQCVTVDLSAPNCTGRAAVMSVTYLNSFNPASVCSNYLADSGAVAGTNAYSFLLPDKTTVVIVVNAVETGLTCGSYTLRVGLCQDRTPTARVPDPDPTNTPPPPPPTFTPQRPSNTPVPPTSTFIPTNTSTRVPPTATFTSTSTRTMVPSSTATNTASPSSTERATFTATATNTPTSTATVTATATSTVTSTNTPSVTATLTPTATPTFQTCPQYFSQDVPVNFTESGEYTSVLTVTQPGIITDIDVVGLSMTKQAGDGPYLIVLIAPSNDRIVLHDWSCTTPVSGTYQLNNVRFDDAAAEPINPCVNSVSGSFKPDPPGLLSDFNGLQAAGVWTLLVEVNNNPFRPGQLTSWGLSICAVSGTATSTATATPTVSPQCPPNGYCITSFTNGGPSSNIPARTMFDEGTVTLTAPFPLTFYDNTYTTVTAGDNGVLQMGTSNPNPSSNACLPTTSLNNALLPYWDSITMLSAGQGIYTDSVGIAPDRFYRIRWIGTIVSTGQSIDVELSFAENTSNGLHFGFNYGTSADSLGATIGVQEGTGSRFTQFTCNAQRISGQTMLFTYLGAPADQQPPQNRTTTATPLFENTSTPTSSPVATITPTVAPTNASTHTATQLPTIPTPLPPSATSSTTQVATASVTLEAKLAELPAQAQPRTLAPTCRVWNSRDVYGQYNVDGTLLSSLRVPVGGEISGLRVVNLTAVKSNSGTVSAHLVAPSGVRGELFRWSCGDPPDGTLQWHGLLLDATARQGISTIYCRESVRGGAYAPNRNALAPFVGLQAGGEWHLELQTNSPRNAALGQLRAWGLEVCYANPASASYLVAGAVSASSFSLQPFFAALLALLAFASVPLVFVRRSTRI